MSGRALKKIISGLAGVALAGVVAFQPGAGRADSTQAAVSGGQLAAERAVRVPQLRYNLVAEGSEARYRVTEQLARIDFPSDAVGATKKIEGGITLADDGSIVKAESKFTVDLTTLQTDNSRRDGYVRRATLETDQYPTAVLVPTGFKGLTFPLPTAGEKTFQLTGELTLHGVTKPTTWDVTARFSGSGVTGTAKTALKFADFDMTQPRVAAVLSVEDNIRLELDFNLATATAGGQD